MLQQSASAPSVSYRSASSRWVPPSSRWQHVRPVNHAPLRRHVSSALPPADYPRQIYGATTLPPARHVNHAERLKQDSVPWPSKPSAGGWRQNALREIESLQAQKGACGKSGLKFAATLSKTANLEAVAEFHKQGNIRSLRREVRAAAFLGNSVEPEILRGKAVLDKLDKMSVQCHQGLAKANTTDVWQALEVTRNLNLGQQKWNDAWLAKGVEDNAMRWDQAGFRVPEPPPKPSTPPPLDLGLPQMTLAELRRECEKIAPVYWNRKMPPTGKFIGELRRRCEEQGLMCNLDEWEVLMLRITDDIEKKAEAAAEAERRRIEAEAQLQAEQDETQRMAVEDELSRLLADSLRHEDVAREAKQVAAAAAKPRLKWNALRAKWSQAKAKEKAQKQWSGLQGKLKKITDPDGRKAAARKKWSALQDNLHDMVSKTHPAEEESEESDDDNDCFPDTDDLDAALAEGADLDALIGSDIWMGVEKDLLAKRICESHSEAEGWIVTHIEHHLAAVRNRDLHRNAVTPEMARSNVYDT